MNGNGHFGHWITDEFGLPAYEYTCNHEFDPKAPSFTASGFSRDHWHQLGNDRLNVLAHNGGYVEVVESSRGLQWLSRRDTKRGRAGGGIAIVEEKGDAETPAWSDLFSQSNFENGYRRVFGTGYFRKTAERNGVNVDHVVFPPFSDDPVVISELSVKNNSNSPKDLILYDYWGIEIQSIIAALIYFDRNRRRFAGRGPLNVIGNALRYASYVAHRAPEQVRNSFSSKFSHESKYISFLKTLILEPKYRGRSRPLEDEASTRNYYPKRVFLSALDAIPIRVIVSTRNLIDSRGKFAAHQEPFRSNVGVEDLPCLCLGVEIHLKPKESRKLTFLLGYASESENFMLINKYTSLLASASEGAQSKSPRERSFPLLNRSAECWARSLVEFSTGDSKKDDWVSREANWHSYYLRSATLYDEFFENHLFPQGGAYNYLQGLQGAPRDFMLYTIPMIYIEPRLAREMLEYTLRLMTPKGRLRYMIHGFGMVSGAVVHTNPSDLPLFLMLGISEYVFATRDFEFLKKVLPFYPKSSRTSSTVLERIKLSIDFLLNEVGIGEHGLIRVGDGDWNDGISTMVKSRRRFIKNGESMFNSALALYVLPRIASILENHDKEYSEKIMAVSEKLRDNCLKSWNGKWFYRGWDGMGNAIGDKNIFLEPVPWLLISGALPRSYASKLINSVYKIADKPSDFGQFLVFPPLKTMFDYLEQGWDVNGGTWFAIDFLLTWGYGRYDPEKAWNSMVKNSLAHHAELYPDVWYGIWSGPDAFNASYARRPGETYYQFPTPTTDFPIMNLNLHANFLLALLKLSGIEPTRQGLNLNPLVPFRNFVLRTPVIEVEFTDHYVQGAYTRKPGEELVLRVKLPKRWRRAKVKCVVNGAVASFKTIDEGGVAEIRIPSATASFKFRISKS